MDTSSLESHPSLHARKGLVMTGLFIMKMKVKDIIFSGPEDPGSVDRRSDNLGTQGPKFAFTVLVHMVVSVSTQAHAQNTRSMHGSVSLISRLEYRLVQWNRPLNMSKSFFHSNT